MQVSSKTVPQQKKGLEKQNQSNEIISSKNISSNNSKINENSNSVKSGEKNETSQYLKVLSRVENLLLQKKLTDAALKKGIFGAPTFSVNKKIFWGQDRLSFAIDEAKK